MRSSSASLASPSRRALSAHTSARRLRPIGGTRSELTASRGASSERRTTWIGIRSVTSDVAALLADEVKLHAVDRRRRSADELRFGAEARAGLDRAGRQIELQIRAASHEEGPDPNLGPARSRVLRLAA